LPEIREGPPFNIKMSTTAPWEALPKIRELPPFNVKMSMADPLGGITGDLGMPTTQCENVDVASRRCCQKSGSAHYSIGKR
jgi:hypothetical protein